MPLQIEPLARVEDTWSMPADGNRYEIIRGEIYTSCAPDIFHQAIVRNLVFVFELFLEKNPIGSVLPGPGVIFNEYSGVIPDVIYISNERSALVRDGRVMGAPEIAIEILSPGAENQHRDRVAKRQLYGKHGVDEYWLIDPVKRTIELYRNAGTSLQLAATLASGDVLTSSLLPNFTCAVERIFKL